MSKAVSAAESMYLDADVEGELQDRLSHFEGHVRGIKRMLSEHASCEDLLLQLSAVRSALNQATGRLLENHMENCVAECVRVGQGEKALRKLNSALAHVIKNLERVGLRNTFARRLRARGKVVRQRLEQSAQPGTARKPTLAVPVGTSALVREREEEFAGGSSIHEY